MLPKYCIVFCDLLKKREHSVGAEVGVWKGQMAQYMLYNLPKLSEYYCIDCWEMYDDFKDILRKGSSYFTSDYNEVYKVYQKRILPYKDRVITLREYSKEAVKKVKDDYLDFVFIDANHAYEYVKEDIELWLPKVRIGGIIAGHDYGLSRFGVTEAVNEKFKEVNRLSGTVWWHLKEDHKSVVRETL